MHDQAAGMQEYAKRAKDALLIGYAAEIKKRSTRRLGEVMDLDRRAGKMAKGARGNPGGRGAKIVRVSQKPTQTLASQQIDKNLANRARVAAAMPEGKFEADVAKTVRIAVAAVEGAKEIITAARVERHETKRRARAKREATWAGKVLALPEKKYGVIYADPEWRFDFWSELGKTNSSADNHYDTSPLDVIKNRDVGSICAEDCVLFLWATAPMKPQALEVMAAWGFTYKSQCVWVKDKAGTGYWFRNKHEVLLVGTRGKVVAPAEGDQFESVIEAPVSKHSKKPEKFYEIIELYFPNVPKIELNARNDRPGWDSWGHEADSSVAEAAE
jgi:N6-adenosine-specific RNA methylase IME4